MKRIIASRKTKDSPNIKENSMDIVIVVTSLVTRLMIVESVKSVIFSPFLVYFPQFWFVFQSISVKFFWF